MTKKLILVFGKYKGKTLQEIPLSYLGWLLNSYTGTSLSKKDIEDEALLRGCVQVEGKWGYYKDSWDNGVGFDISRPDFLGNFIIRTFKEESDLEEDPFDYEGIPNSY